MSVGISIGETKAVTVKVGEKVYIKGDPGFSPTIEVTDITGGHRLTITDINGDKTVDVMNGANGDKGDTGNGIEYIMLNADYTLTVHYTNGTEWTSASIRGEKGDKGDPGEVTQAEFDDLAGEVSNQKSAIEDLETLVDRKAGALVDTASGAIASFVPDSTIPDLLGVSVAVEPVQDLHGQASPWPAGGGVNKFDKDHSINSTYNSSIATVLSNYKSTGEYATGYTTNATSINNNAQYCTSFTPCTSGTTYTIKNLTSGSNLALIGFVDDSGTVVSHNSAWSNQAWTHTADATEKYIMVCVKVSELENVMIVEGSTMPTTPSPYSNICPISGWDAISIWNKPTHDTTLPPTVTIQLGQTVYGGTLDATAGTMTVDMIGVDMGSVNWSKNTVTHGTLWRHTFDDMANAVSTIKADILCSLYPTVPQTQRAENTLSANNKNVDVIDSDYSTAADFKAAVTGQTIVYPLATPITIQIDPVTISAISGQPNNVWSDAGDVDVEYAADIKAYIDRLNQPTEDDMVANNLIASGKYFTVNNRLFLSTASIAAGAQIIPGHNCTETNLAAALNALNA